MNVKINEPGNDDAIIGWYHAYTEERGNDDAVDGWCYISTNKRQFITKGEFNKKLEQHDHWCRKDCAGWDTMQAGFIAYHFENVDFNNIFLHDIEFTSCCFKNCRFIDAIFNTVDFSVSLFETVDFSGSLLNNVNFTFACFREIRFENITFSGLPKVNFMYANFENCAMSNDCLPTPYVCPSDGSFIGWKVCESSNGTVIVKLRILEDSKRSSGTGRKCRCDKAEVLSIENVDGSPCSASEAVSFFDPNFTYEVGQVVYAPSFDEDRWKECSNGLHFFITRQEAIDYGMMQGYMRDAKEEEGA